MLAAQNLDFAYGDGPNILSDLNFILKEAEIVSLLGPSGCGKSTVLRLIADLLQPTAGSLKWETEQKLGFVFQDHALMPWARVSDNVSLPQRLGGAINENTISEALEAVGMVGLEKRYPSELSGGQRMRVSIARALAAEPTLLLMDEPFAALDEILRFQMNELLLRLRQEKQFAVLFVTHSLYEAAYLSDRIAVMGSGSLAGWVEPKLDRSKTADEQRTSPEFLSVINDLSALMAGPAA